MSQHLAPLDIARREIFSPEVRQSFDMAVCDQRIKFETEAGFAMQIVQNNPYLQKIAAGNLPSLRAAITNVAAIGVSLNPARKQAYLVPRKGALCLDISYMGLMDLAMDTGAIQWGQARVVRKADQFELRGLDQAPSHSFNPFAVDRGEIVGVYVVVKTASGDYLTHAMPISAVYSIRDRSEAWKAFVSDSSKKCPWNTDEEEMIKKTCVKQAFKYWPKNTRLDAAVHHLNTEGGEGFAERDMGPAVIAVDTTGILAEVDKINDLDVLRAKKAEWNKECIAAKDLNAWGAIKAAISVRVTELSGSAAA